jgi:hypothetical protein
MVNMQPRGFRERISSVKPVADGCGRGAEGASRPCSLSWGNRTFRVSIIE